MLTSGGAPTHSLFSVFSSRISKHLRRAGCIRHASCLLHHQRTCPYGVSSVIEVRRQAPWVHFLETNDQHTIRCTVANHRARYVQTRAPCRAVIVHVINWNRGQAELVEDSLAAGGVAIAIAGHTLIDFIVRDMSIKHGFDAGFKSEFSVVDLSAGFDELRHAHAEDVRWRCLPDHGCSCLGIKGEAFCRRQVSRWSSVSDSFLAPCRCRYRGGLSQ